MNEINPKNILLNVYEKSSDISDIDLDNDILVNISHVLERISTNKAVYTVIITLALYKYLHPEQDIRQHKIELQNGFSGRSFDHKYVTPTLSELGLPTMAESGWLTRSLEQAYPYDMNYKGKITPEKLKVAFLRVVDYIELGGDNPYNILRVLLNGGIKFKEKNMVSIKRIENEEIKIERVIQLLKEHFEFVYKVHGGSKLPVIAFYAIYQILLGELDRFNNCQLSNLGSHTASDRTSNSGGDLQIFREGHLFEALEIKLGKAPDLQMVRVAYDKINRFGIARYYILSTLPICEKDIPDINNLIDKIGLEHGCQLIINGLYPSLKYYLRLISNPNIFLNKYIELVEKDNELQIIHKEKLKELIDYMKIY